MNALIDMDTVQTIMENGKPAFAVIPYDQFKLICNQMDNRKVMYASDEIPHEVVSYIFEKHYSIVKAWRLYLRMNQKEAAEKIGITQGALSQIEKSESNQQGTLQKIADAWGIHVEQLEV